MTSNLTRGFTGSIPPDPEFDAKVKDICHAYEQATTRAEQDELAFSVDELTGIQALEGTMPDIAMKPGRCTLVEFEYIRHGTRTLIASFNIATNIATGQVDQATVGDTCTEQDLDTHLRQSKPVV